MSDVDRIIFLMEEIAILESRFLPEDTGHLRTAVNVLKERVEELRKLRKIAKDFYKDYNAEIDQNLLASMFEMYYYNVPKSQHAPIFKKLENQLFGFKNFDFDFFAKNLFNQSYFSSEEKCLRFLKNPTKTLVEKDPAYVAFNSIYEKYLKELFVLYWTEA